MKQDKAQAEFAVAPTYLTLRAVAVRFIFSLSRLESVTSLSRDSIQTCSVMRDEAKVEKVQYVSISTIGKLKSHLRVSSIAVLHILLSLVSIREYQHSTT